MDVPANYYLAFASPHYREAVEAEAVADEEGVPPAVVAEPSERRKT